ncbi:MAG: response regulator [Deltaproteobacteria bacterium]|nr:MAG: response regulator [Deltaproteobacteria bacterium]
MEEDAGKKILIVDDEKAIRDILSNTLVCWGYQVAVASSGIEALNLFLRRSFDLVLTDLNMPGIDGWTLAIHVKDKSPNTPVGLMTAQDKEGVMKKLEGSCVDFALFKPFTLEDIEETVATILGNRALEKGIPLSSINTPCISEKLRGQ